MPPTLLELLAQLKVMIDKDNKFFEKMNELRQRNQINFDNMDFEVDVIARASAKAFYLKEMAKGLEEEATFIENSKHIYEKLEQVFAEAERIKHLI